MTRSLLMNHPSRYGGTPTIALFAVHGGFVPVDPDLFYGSDTRGRYKREAYRGSPFAARVLADNGIPVVMKVGVHRRRPLGCS